MHTCSYLINNEIRSLLQIEVANEITVRDIHVIINYLSVLLCCTDSYCYSNGFKAV